MKTALKALTAGLIALGSITTTVTPAEAGTCWFMNGSQRVRGQYCQIGRRVNANGHRVIDIADRTGKVTVVIWDDNTAEVLSSQIPYRYRWFDWYIDNTGDYRLSNRRGYEFSFRG